MFEVSTVDTKQVIVVAEDKIDVRRQGVVIVQHLAQPAAYLRTVWYSESYFFTKKIDH